MSGLDRDLVLANALCRKIVEHPDDPAFTRSIRLNGGTTTLLEIARELLGEDRACVTCRGSGVVGGTFEAHACPTCDGTGDA